MNSAMRVTAVAFAVIVALAGIEHGVGEILQGSVPPPALVFESWPDSEFLEILAGEPALSVLPNLLLSGILTVAFSLVLIAWAVIGSREPYFGAGLVLLSIVLLLFGGGLGPPFMLFVVGLAATRIHRPLSWWRPRSAGRPPPPLARLWRAALVASVLGYLALLPGIPLAGQLFGPLDPAIVVIVGIFSFASFFLAIIAALASDSYDSNAAAQ